MDELRGLPQNIEAEQSVVGSMMLKPECISDVVALLSRDDFALPTHRDIYETLYAMYMENKPIDAITLLGEMKNRGVYDDNSTRDYVYRVLNIPLSVSYVKQYAELVRQQSLLRRLDECASQISDAAREPGAKAEMVLDSAEQLIYDIRKGRDNNNMYPIHSVLIDVYQQIKQLREDGGRLPGLTSGIYELDDVLGGLINSNFVLVASRPGMGKTSFALGVGLSAARQSGKAIAFFTLEMPRDQLVMRLLSSESMISSQKLLTGALDKEEWAKIGEASGMLSKIPYHFDDNPMISVGEMKAKCRRVPNLGMVIIDYLQLMQGTPGKRYDNRTGEVGDISRSLKIMAKELNVPVLCCAQLSRENEKRGDKRPMLSDLRESGSIEQDADVVMFLYRDDYYNEDSDPNLAELIISKNRHGRTGKIELFWSGEHTSYRSIDRRYE